MTTGTLITGSITRTGGTQASCADPGGAGLIAAVARPPQPGYGPRLAGELTAGALGALDLAPRVADADQAEHPARRDQQRGDQHADAERVHRCVLHGEGGLVADDRGVGPGQRLPPGLSQRP